MPSKLSSSSWWVDLEPPSPLLGWSCAIALEEFFSRIWANMAPLFCELDAFLFWGSCFPALPLADAFRLTPNELLALLCWPVYAPFVVPPLPSWFSWARNSSSSRLLLFSLPCFPDAPPSIRHSVSSIFEFGPFESLLTFFYLEESVVRIWFLEAGLSFLCPYARLPNSDPASAEFLCYCKTFLSNCGGSAAYVSESTTSWLFFLPSPACVIDYEWWWLPLPVRAYPSLYFPSDFCFENFRASLSIEWESLWFCEFL